jgi:hypothetical protein
MEQAAKALSISGDDLLEVAGEGFFGPVKRWRFVAKPLDSSRNIDATGSP